MPFIGKDAAIQGRQFLVQEVQIPFTVTASATAANIALACDEPARLYLKSASVDQITAALATNETATFTTSPTDATGILNALLIVNESVVKVIGATMVHRDKIGQTSQGAFLGSATGVTTGTGGGNSIMLAVQTGVNHTTTNVAGLLKVSYVTLF